jgi:hypothetical protein
LTLSDLDINPVNGGGDTKIVDSNSGHLFGIVFGVDDSLITDADFIF